MSTLSKSNYEIYSKYVSQDIRAVKGKKQFDHMVGELLFGAVSITPPLEYPGIWHRRDGTNFGLRISKAFGVVIDLDASSMRNIGFRKLRAQSKPHQTYLRQEGLSDLDTYLLLMPGEVFDNGIGIYAPYVAGKYYLGLNDESLSGFLRRCILSLLQHGALPAHEGSFTEDRILEELHYGNDTPDEIADGILRDMRALGRPPDWGEFWFRLPDDPTGSNC